MKRKLLVLLALIMSISLVFAVASCTVPNNTGDKGSASESVSDPATDPATDPAVDPDTEEEPPFEVPVTVEENNHKTDMTLGEVAAKLYTNAASTTEGEHTVAVISASASYYVMNTKQPINATLDGKAEIVDMQFNMDLIVNSNSYDTFTDEQETEVTVEYDDVTELYLRGYKLYVRDGYKKATDTDYYYYQGGKYRLFDYTDSQLIDTASNYLEFIEILFTDYIGPDSSDPLFDADILTALSYFDQYIVYLETEDEQGAVVADGDYYSSVNVEYNDMLNYALTTVTEFFKSDLNDLSVFFGMEEGELEELVKNTNTIEEQLDAFLEKDNIDEFGEQKLKKALTVKDICKMLELVLPYSDLPEYYYELTNEEMPEGLVTFLEERGSYYDLFAYETSYQKNEEDTARTPYTVKDLLAMVSELIDGNQCGVDGTIESFGSITMKQVLACFADNEYVSEAILYLQIIEAVKINTASLTFATHVNRDFNSFGVSLSGNFKPALSTLELDIFGFKIAVDVTFSTTATLADVSAFELVVEQE